MCGIFLKMDFREHHGVLTALELHAYDEGMPMLYLPYHIAQVDEGICPAPELMPAFLKTVQRCHHLIGRCALVFRASSDLLCYGALGHRYPVIG